MRRTFAVLLLLAAVASTAVAQRVWQTEIGIQGGFTRIVVPGQGATDGFSLPGGGRIELNYTMFGKNADLGIPPVNIMGLMFGAMVPLK